MWRLLISAPLFLLLALQSNAAERVVSLNLCTDQMLVLLAPEKVAALSPLARDPSPSFVAQQAEHLPIVRASAEAVLHLHPDLILAAPYGAQTTLALLEREHIAILRVPLPQNFDDIRRMTRQVADALDVPERGAAMLAAMDAQLAALRRPGPRLRALVWEPRGFTAGPDTMMGAILRAAGLSNASDGHRVGLEALLRHPPDLLILPTAPAYPSLATALLKHPALSGIPRRTIPPALTICAGPFSAQAAALLAQ
jgi:iron complex transport system substrate-binding protein